MDNKMILTIIGAALILIGLFKFFTLNKAIRTEVKQGQQDALSDELKGRIGKELSAMIGLVFLGIILVVSSVLFL
ncbi:MAG: hypothetical protein ACI35R_03775 [Bacillus sp. (in: firmicutes)]